MRPDRPHAAELPDREHPAILSREGRAELLGALLVLAAALYLLPAARAWLEAHAERVQMSALSDCRVPREAEQLHVVVYRRGDRLVHGGCLYVGGPGTPNP